MIHVGENTRLTDDLERRLLRQEIENQFRLQPVVSLKNLFAKLAGNGARAARSDDMPANAKTAH